MGFALWTVAYLHDQDAIPLVRALGLHADAPPYITKQAGVVLALLEHRIAEVVDGIRQHDHDRMGQLVMAARMIGTEESSEALDACARAAPDIDCRIECRRAFLSGAFRDDPPDDLRERLIDEFGAENFPEPGPARSYTLDSGGRLIRIEEGYRETRQVVWEAGANPPVIPDYVGPYPSLHQLCTGYLGMQSLALFRDWRSAVEAFASETEPGALRTLLSEVDRLRVAIPNEEERRALIASLGSAFDPSRERLTTDAWLGTIAAMVDHATTAQSANPRRMRRGIGKLLPFRRPGK
jgi:hypothetical protein